MIVYGVGNGEGDNIRITGPCFAKLGKWERNHKITHFVRYIGDVKEVLYYPYRTGEGPRSSLKVEQDKEVFYWLCKKSVWRDAFFPDSYERFLEEDTVYVNPNVCSEYMINTLQACRFLLSYQMKLILPKFKLDLPTSCIFLMLTENFSFPGEVIRFNYDHDNAVLPFCEMSERRVLDIIEGNISFPFKGQPYSSKLYYESILDHWKDIYPVPEYMRMNEHKRLNPKGNRYHWKRGIFSTYYVRDNLSIDYSWLHDLKKEIEELAK
jgi:hypothetical protein